MNIEFTCNQCCLPYDLTLDDLRQRLDSLQRGETVDHLCPNCEHRWGGLDENLPLWREDELAQLVRNYEELESGRTGHTKYDIEYRRDEAHIRQVTVVASSLDRQLFFCIDESKNGPFQSCFTRKPHSLFDSYKLAKENYCRQLNKELHEILEKIRVVRQQLDELEKAEQADSDQVGKK